MFGKVEEPTLSGMINEFKQHFYSFKEYFKNAETRNQFSSESTKLHSNMQNLEWELKKIESEFNTASDTEVIECSDDFRLFQSEFEDFKKRFQTAVRVISDDQNNSNNYNQYNGNYYDQEMIDEQTNELDHINSEVREIVQTSKEINRISHQVDQEIKKQRVQIIKIDKVTNEAVGKMEKGNRELNKAEEYQKGCTIC